MQVEQILKHDTFLKRRYIVAVLPA